VDPVRAEHVRDLVRVDHDRGRPEWEEEPGDLVHEELRRLEVHVRVDEARDDPAAARVDRLGALVLAQAGHVAVHQGHVRLEPLAREDAEDAATADDDVGGLVPPSDGEAAAQRAGARTGRHGSGTKGRGASIMPS
jgi:hypothetical protein